MIHKINKTNVISTMETTFFLIIMYIVYYDSVSFSQIFVKKIKTERQKSSNILKCLIIHANAFLFIQSTEIWGKKHSFKFFQCPNIS